MKGKDHIYISLMWAFFIVTPILLSYPVYFLAFLIGTLLGSVFPDIDASSSPYKKRGDVMRATGIAAHSSSKLTIFLFRLFGGSKSNDYGNHRGLIHSVPGIIISVLIIVIPINLILFAIGYWNITLVYGSIGFFAGAIFHLLEDCCTCSGVHLFYPFSDKKLRGGINTYLPDSRPKKFGVMFAVLSVIYLVYDVSLRKIPMFSQYDFISVLSIYELMAITVVIGFIVWIIMFGWSQNPYNCSKKYR